MRKSLYLDGLFLTCNYILKPWGSKADNKALLNFDPQMTNIHVVVSLTPKKKRKEKENGCGVEKGSTCVCLQSDPLLSIVIGIWKPLGVSCCDSWSTHHHSTNLQFEILL